MDTFRKWLNKPKADDKSLLARFYHADRSLSAVASELDSFDGRAEPDRCSRLVTRLRQGQDRVLSITNLIMEEILGAERDVRAFRAKFPEEVLQENLAGQLWFGAECLAAGSSIMNREQESKDMRPLAQAVTKSLVNVRSLLREHCLRSNVPNSKKLHLDINDATTEQLYESLKIFDRLFAEFELHYVSAMVQVKTKEEYEMQELICVLFSETLQRALKLELIEQDKVDSFDPALMFSIPRLAIITGLIIFPEGPLNMDLPAEELSEMFRPFCTILIKIRNLLRRLTKHELLQLQKLLCTNEDIHPKTESTSILEVPSTEQETNNSYNQSANSQYQINSKDNNLRESSNIAPEEIYGSSHSEDKQQGFYHASRSPSPGSSISSKECSTPHSSLSSSYSRTPSHSTTSSTTAPSDTYISLVDNDNWSDNENDNDIDDNNDVPSVEAVDTDESSSDAIDEEDHRAVLTADCASGYLIPNTNLGNLLQPLEVPLTGNFVASDDQFIAQLRELGLEEVDVPAAGRIQDKQDLQISQTLNRISDSSEECERITSPTEKNVLAFSNNCGRCYEEYVVKESSSSRAVQRHYHHRHHDSHSNGYYQSHHHQTKPLRQKLYNYGSKTKKRQTVSELTKVMKPCSVDISSDEIEKRAKSANVSPSHSHSDEPKSNSNLLPYGRLQFKNTENLLHRLFVCIAGVADQLQTNFASDLRHILRSVFLMNMSIAQEVLDIPEKIRDSELFEFRASENDVIQQEGGGSNHSIYSAEEVNAELDNVFTNNSNNRNRFAAGPTNQQDTNLSGVQLARSRSVGDENQSEAAATTSRCCSSYVNGQTYSSSFSPIEKQITHTSYNEHKNSIGRNSSNTSSSSTMSSPLSTDTNSPLSDQASSNSGNNSASHQNIDTLNFRMSPPVWIPDDKAPRCMSCRTHFTAFRRRHHCRNCGGVFCGVCSNASTPLPKYGLTKAVRVCRECYMREKLSSMPNSPQQYSCTATRTRTSSSTTAGGL